MDFLSRAIGLGVVCFVVGIIIAIILNNVFKLHKSDGKVARNLFDPEILIIIGAVTLVIFYAAC